MHSLNNFLREKLTHIVTHSNEESPTINEQDKDGKTGLSTSVTEGLLNLEEVTGKARLREQALS